VGDILLCNIALTDIFYKRGQNICKKASYQPISNAQSSLANADVVLTLLTQSLLLFSKNSVSPSAIIQSKSLPAVGAKNTMTMSVGLSAHIICPVKPPTSLLMASMLMMWRIALRTSIRIVTA
jgi:hypothetical protein